MRSDGRCGRGSADLLGSAVRGSLDLRTILPSPPISLLIPPCFPGVGRDSARIACFCRMKEQRPNWNVPDATSGALEDRWCDHEAGS